MAELNLILAGAVGALAAGSAAAQLCGPQTTDWRARHSTLKRRLIGLAGDPPKGGGRLLGVVALAATLTGGALAAYAAEPSAPERLASQAAGVVGSGDQLSLKVKEAAGERTLKVGEAYADGWTLQALTATKATLAKDGAIREVGLNPTGQIASAAPTAEPSTVTLAGLPDAATVQAFLDRAPAAGAPPPAQLMAQAAKLGLSQEETGRYFVYMTMAQTEALRQAPAGSRSETPDLATLRAMFGDAGFNDFVAIRTQANANGVAQMAADLIARPPAGPSSYYVPAGAVSSDVASAQGVDNRGMWTSSPPDAQGGRTLTRMPAVAESMAAAMAVNPTGLNPAPAAAQPSP